VAGVSPAYLSAVIKIVNNAEMSEYDLAAIAFDALLGSVLVVPNVN